MSKPTKLNQVVPGDTLTTCAPLPANVNPDGRSTNLVGVEGPFVVSGPLLEGNGIISFPNAIISTTWTPDQIVGTFIGIALGTNSFVTPTAAQIVNYLTSQYAKVPTAAFPNNATAPVSNVYPATPAFYPAFTMRIGTIGQPTINMGTGCLYYPAGPLSTGTNTFGILATNSVNSYVAFVTNATPGAEAVAFLRI